MIPIKQPVTWNVGVFFLWLPKNERLELNLKITQLQLLKDRNIIWTRKKSTIFLGGGFNVLFSKGFTIAIMAEIYSGPRRGPESGTEDSRGLPEEGERDAWAGNHSEPKLFKG